jgi:hypothetical protein
MGTAGKAYAAVIPIEPGDTQARVLFIPASDGQGKPKARVVMQREGEADIHEDIELKEVAA